MAKCNAHTSCTKLTVGLSCPPIRSRSHLADHAITITARSAISKNTDHSRRLHEFTDHASDHNPRSHRSLRSANHRFLLEMVFIKNMGKAFVHLVGVFCTHLEPPICHIIQKIKVFVNYRSILGIFHYIILYSCCWKGRRQRRQPLNYR